MITVVSKGFDEFKVDCQVCGATLLYNRSDVERHISGNGIVCPECGHHVEHSLKNIVRRCRRCGVRMDHDDTIHFTEDFQGPYCSACYPNLISKDSR